MFSFPDHVDLLSRFLDRRRDIVDRIESRLLNVRGKPLAQTRDRKYFDQLLTACFFEAPGVPRHLQTLKGQLAATHLADGFEPVLIDNYAHELDPLELLVRAYQYWDQHRWPGSSGRLTYAQGLYSVFMLRQLEPLSLRIWDEGNDLAADRLREVQALLDRLNAPASPSVLVRDVRWLMQTAQGPLTRHLRPYFVIAEQIATSLAPAARVELHTAGAKLAGGHLRSQLRYRVWNSQKPIDDPELLAFTRNANSMDLALLVRDLVPLLEAYDAACAGRDEAERLDLADAILQGLSADPELTLVRLDLLAPYTMIEDLFVEPSDAGGVRYTRMGAAQVGLLECYGALIGRLAGPLKNDAATFDPSRLPYSPLGASYGFSADLLANMALDALVSQDVFGLSLENLFAGRGHLDDKLTRARGWMALSTREGERDHFDHSPDWAAQMFARLMASLDARVARPAASNASPRRRGRLCVGAAPAGAVAAQEYCLTSDLDRAMSSEAIAQPKSRILLDRSEGRFLASAESGGQWFGVSKLVLTAVLGQGQDALVRDVPPAVVEVLSLTCPTLVSKFDPEKKADESET